MWRVQNYNVFKEISKVSTSWQVAKTAGLIMSQKWLSLVFILITRVLKNVFSMWSKELQSGSKKHNQTKSTRFLQMRSWHYHKTSRYNVSCTSEKTEKLPQISDVKVYLQTVKIKLATVTSIWLVIPLLSDIISRWMMAVCMFIWHMHLPEIIPILFLHLLMGSFKSAVNTTSRRLAVSWSERKNGQTGIFRYRFKKGGPTVWDIYRDDTIPHSKTKS